MTTPYKPGRKTGEYEELREQVDLLVKLGFKIQKIIDTTGAPSNSIYDWLKGRRNLNHETAQAVEQSLAKLKQEVNDIIK